MTAIYMVINKTNNKKYIGITDNTGVRFADHKNLTKKKPTLLKQAMIKHGVDSFEFSIIEVVTNRTVASELETVYIQKYNSKHPSGYNLTTGGDNGYYHNDLTKKKISETMMGRDMPWRDKINKTTLANNKKKTKEELSEQYGHRKGHFGVDHNRYIPTILDDYNEVYKMYITEGKTQQQIADIVGVSISVVANRLARHNIRKNK